MTDVAKFVAALGAQGKVSLVANPRLLAMNNEPAIVRAVSGVSGGPNGSAGESVTLSVTPQICARRRRDAEPEPDRRVAELVGRREDAGDLDHSRGRHARARRRRRDLVDGRLHAASARCASARTPGIKGGWFGRATVVTKKRIELVVLLTPKVLGDETAP